MFRWSKSLLLRFPLPGKKISPSKISGSPHLPPLTAIWKALVVTYSSSIFSVNGITLVFDKSIANFKRLSFICPTNGLISLSSLFANKNRQTLGPRNDWGIERNIVRFNLLLEEWWFDFHPAKEYLRFEKHFNQTLLLTCIL